MSVSLIQRILVVDDEKEYQELVRKMLKMAGYAAEVSSDALDALKKLQEHPFDLVISDIQMGGGMNGLELAREARKNYPHLDFIIVTGYAADYSYSDIISAGASDFIAKPFFVEELKAKIERIERERQVIRSLRQTNESLSGELAVNASIVELSKALIASLTFESISSIVLYHAKKLTDSALGYVGYIEPQTGHLVCTSMAGEVLSECEIPGKSIVFEEYRGLWGWVLENREPILTNSPEADCRSSGVPKGHMHIQRFLSVPAMASGTLLGQISLANSNRDYTEKDLRRAKCLADVYAVAIQRKWADEELKQTCDRLQSIFEETVGALTSALEMRDPYTAGHQRRVANLSCAIARELGLSQSQVEAVRMAGLVHDIGKISVPFEILSKPAGLREIELNLIRDHSSAGFNILKKVEFPWPIAQIELQHHERIDGSGYPQGLSGEEMLLEARIIAVADVIEAMSSHRPYRAALGIECALDDISMNRGKLYDPDVVDACLRLFREKGYTLE